jgi:Zn-finger nucleic acid-binding protein
MHMMKCPVCRYDLLRETTLESDLPAFKCLKCEGIWIASNQYLQWLKTDTTVPHENVTSDPSLPTWETQELKLCPDCGRILSRYKILPNIEFYLDRCGHCNGVWLDKNEWDVLLAHDLQNKVNQFFTQPWQAKLHEEETKGVLEKLYLDKFGEADYAKIKEVWEWLKAHPQRSMLIAFLQADNPYKI